ncbi:MAG: ABC transporter substrate-binding protein, partial [Gemmatimonadota bacterium]|nr:ABC transporter substrate-binding protein [Gemmatimonadota bacterium]
MSSFRTLRALCLSLLLAGCGDDVPIKIGLVGPFAEPRATSMRIAAELAVEEINAAGGLRGRPVELVVLDDSGQAAGAVAAAQQLVADPSVVAVVGHLTSGATLAAAPTYRGTRPVAVVSPSASSPLLTDAGPWMFRVCPADAVHGVRLAAWAKERLGARRAAVLYINDDYGRGLRDVFVEAFTGAGGEVVTLDPYLDDLPSFRPYLERLRRRGGADVLLIAGTRTGAARILATRDSLGLDFPVIGGDGIVGVEQIGAAAEGVFISTAYLSEAPGTANAAFVRAYRTASGNRLPDHRGAGAYDAVHLIARAVEAVGTGREDIRDYLARVGTSKPAYDGVTGRVAFDEHGDVPEKSTVMGVVRNGALRVVEGS